METTKKISLQSNHSQWSCVSPAFTQLPVGTFPASSPERIERELRKSRRRFMPVATAADQRPLLTESNCCWVRGGTMNNWPQPDPNHLIPTDDIIMSSYMYLSFLISNQFSCDLSVFVSLHVKNTIRRTISQQEASSVFTRQGWQLTLGLAA